MDYLKDWAILIGAVGVAATSIIAAIFSGYAVLYAAKAKFHADKAIAEAAVANTNAAVANTNANAAVAVVAAIEPSALTQLLAEADRQAVVSAARQAAVAERLKATKKS